MSRSGEKSGAEGNVCRCHRVIPDTPDGKVQGVTDMTRAEHDRRKRQMNRRIREVLAVRRMLAAMDPQAELPDPATHDG